MRTDASSPSDGDTPLLPATLFLGGDPLVWTGFSGGAAALAQWRLRDDAIVTADGESRSAVFAAVLLLGAGAYQLSPLKQACLRSCRSPLFFLLGAWRPGAFGALRMGVRHGVICVGCCWALMALMFVGGAMNLLWCAAPMLWMLAEKVLPAGARLGHAAGVGLLAAGALALGGALFAA